MGDRAVTERQARDPAEGHDGAAPAGGGSARRKALALGVLDGHLGYWARRLQLWIFQDFVRTLAEFDIRPAQYSVLVVIEANPGLSQADLADALGIERARLVRLLDGLERRGFTQRLASPSDRRSHALFLMREGQKALKRIKALAALHESRVQQELGAERRHLLMAALKDVRGAR